MSKKTKSILIFLFGLLISLFLGYSVWESGYLQTADNKASQEQEIASDTSEEDKAAADQAAADKAAADKVAEEQAAADKAAEEKAATDKAAADQAAADKAAEEKAAMEKAAADKAAMEKAAAEKATQELEAIQNAMGFDVLRIEPTGGAVVAGQAPAGSKVALVNALDQNKTISQAITSEAGEFALVLDTPLREGKHELYIHATGEGDSKYISNEVALVEIFAASLNKTPVVILSKAGAATRMLQGEETQVAENTGEDAATTEEANTTEETASEENTAETEQVEEKPAPVNAVFIKAADVEGGKLILAGTGPADSTLNIYLNDQLLGQTKITENNSYLFERNQTLEAGRHKIRADRIDPATNKVLGRAEVSLIHKLEVAAVEETTTEPATEETVTEETATEETATEETTAEETTAEETTTEESTTNVATTTTEEQTTTQVETDTEPKEEIHTGTTVIIRRGDSLWRVSRKNYGEGMKFTTIFDANKDQIKDPNLIYPGQVFTIPEAQ